MNIVSQTTDTGLTPGLLQVLHKQVFFLSSQMYIDLVYASHYIYNGHLVIHFPSLVRNTCPAGPILAISAAKVQQERAAEQMEGPVFAPRAAGHTALLGQLRLRC